MSTLSEQIAAREAAAKAAKAKKPKKKVEAKPDPDLETPSL
tara:strand:+ start:337 stop:459 length:123 start_codon:yes stop_codon:yes gene_type:complete